MNADQIFIEVNGRRRSLAWLIDNAKAATDVWVFNCPGLNALPDLPAATVVRVFNCPGLNALPELPAATHVRVDNCPGLNALPELPAATHVRVDNCPLLIFKAGVDARGYEFTGIKIRDGWFVRAGCRFMSIADARRHWGVGGSRYRADCADLVEKIAAASLEATAIKAAE